MRSSSPNIGTLLSGELRDGAGGHDEPEAEHDERAGCGQEPDEGAVEAQAAEGPPRRDGEEADGGDGRGEADAEGDDQQEAVADPVERDRREQDDEGGRARDDPRRGADADQAAEAGARLRVAVVRVVVSMTVAVIVVVVAVIASLMVSYTRARAEALGVECKVGIADRAVRVVILSAGLVLAKGASILDVELLEPAVWLLAGLSVITVGQRIFHVRRELTRPAVL
jgi:hypothetical protein